MVCHYYLVHLEESNHGKHMELVAEISAALAARLHVVHKDCPSSVEIRGARNGNGCCARPVVMGCRL